MVAIGLDSDDAVRLSEPEIISPAACPGSVRSMFNPRFNDCFLLVWPLGAVENMSTELCVLVVRGEEQQARSREVGCQWEEEDEKENEEVQRREVACQSDFVERRDAEVQVDLLTQQLVLTQPGEVCRNVSKC